jgi:hypothetical protein
MIVINFKFLEASSSAGLPERVPMSTRLQTLDAASICLR